MRHRFDRFSEENFPKNLVLVDQLQALADKKGISLVKLALAWVAKMGTLPIPGSRRTSGVKEAIEARDVELSDEELKEIRTVIDAAEVVGLRYNSHMEGGLAI